MDLIPEDLKQWVLDQLEWLAKKAWEWVKHILDWVIGLLSDHWQWLQDTVLDLLSELLVALSEHIPSLDLGSMADSFELSNQFFPFYDLFTTFLLYAEFLAICLVARMVKYLLPGG